MLRLSGGIHAQYRIRENEEDRLILVDEFKQEFYNILLRSDHFHTLNNSSFLINFFGHVDATRAITHELIHSSAYMLEIDWSPGQSLNKVDNIKG